MTDPYPATPAQPLAPSDEKLWSTLAHVGNIVGFLPSLLIFLILGPRSVRVKQESREALNFVITVVIAIIALSIVNSIIGALAANLPSAIALVFVLIGFVVGLVIFAVYVLAIVFSIVAAVRVNAGGTYRYPYSLRLIK